jgi:ankyrin repeat protein
MVGLLLSKGADVHATDVNGSTPLHHAANMGNLRAAELLIERGADVNARDSNGRTPLYWSAKHEERGVDVSLYRSFGVEANFNHTGVSRVLREKGGVRE